MLHHGFARQVAVEKRMERCYAAPSPQLDESWVTRHVAAYRGHVEEIPNQWLNLGERSHADERSDPKRAAKPPSFYPR